MVVLQRLLVSGCVNRCMTFTELSPQYLVWTQLIQGIEVTIVKSWGLYHKESRCQQFNAIKFKDDKEQVY